MRSCERPAGKTRTGPRCGLSSTRPKAVCSIVLQLGPYRSWALSARAGWARSTGPGHAPQPRASPSKSPRRGSTPGFEREARAVAALKPSAHFCTLYDVGPNYLVMEYVEGRPCMVRCRWRRRFGWLSRWRMPWKLRIARGSCIGPETRQRAGDRIGGEGAGDFGLAKMEEPASSGEETGPHRQARTEEGTIVALPAYMFARAAEGKPVDARSDIFSFGAVPTKW